MVLLQDKKEVKHIIEVLKRTQQALIEEDSYKLNQLSDQTIHSASVLQHTDFITIAVIIYSLNKILPRKKKTKQKSWESFVKKFNLELEKSIEGLEEKQSEEFVRHLNHAKDLLVDLAPTIQTNVLEVLKKAALNKASRIHEHGISLAQTANLLGITQWDLAEYIGQRDISNNPYNATIEVKKRAKMALDFFEK